MEYFEKIIESLKKQGLLTEDISHDQDLIQHLKALSIDNYPTLKNIVDNILKEISNVPIPDVKMKRHNLITKDVLIQIISYIFALYQNNCYIIEELEETIYFPEMIQSNLCVNDTTH